MSAVPPSPSWPGRHDLVSAHLPAALWLVAMTVALAVPANTADLPPWWPDILHFHALDKVIHFFLFSIAGALLARSFRRLRGLARPALWACLAASAYGGLTEIGQHFFTARHGELGDVAADVAGAMVGSGLVALMARRGAGPREAGMVGTP